jgi:hypothetical protein
VGIARQLNVSDQTVYNWIQRGLPCRVDGRGRKWFDLAKCREWAERNHVVIGGHGGSRSRAGRKKRGTTIAEHGPELPIPPEAGTDERAAFDHAVGRDAARDAARKKLLALKSDEGLLDAMMPEQYQGMSLVEAERLIRILKARAAQIELDETLKRVLPTADVCSAVAEIFNATRSRIQSWPASLTDRLMAELKLEPEKQRVVRAAIEKVVKEALDSLGKELLSVGAADGKSAA